MSEKSDSVRRWRNPSFVESAGAEKVSGSLLMGSALRDRVLSGWALGTFIIDLPDPATLTAVSLAGFDFAVLDMEHSSVDFTKLEALIKAGHAAGLAMLVRPWGEDIGLIGKVLDMGAHGIMAPHVDTPERARAVVSQARFAPRGNRGFSPLTKYDSLKEPLHSLDESTYVVIQIEGRAAIDRVEDIAKVPGIDAIFVGPYDLALSLGVPPGSKEVIDAAGRIAAAVPDNLGLGIYIDDPTTCGDWTNSGFALQCVSFDGRMLADGARSVVKRARSSVSGREGKQKP